MTRLALIASFLLAACGGASSSPPAAPSAAEAPAAPQDDDPSCPVAVPGTSVTVEDTPTGAAMVFVTTGDVAELRKRVASMVQMHNDQHSKMGPLPTGDEPAADPHAGHGGGEHAGHAGGMISVHARAVSEDVDGGARFVLVVAPADVGKVQEELRMHAQHFASGSCSMEHMK